MNNIYVLNKNYSKIGTLSNQGANPPAPYYEDLYVQELETGADTYQFSTMSTPYTQDLLEIGNHIMFTYKNRNELFTITSLEYSHNEGYKTIGVYAEGIGFDLLEIYMKRPENEKENSSDDSEGGRDEDNDGDTSTDNEYADLDDVYVDENGIIIYNKYGQDDYADPDNVSVDGNGIIIYRRSKNNRKNDSLEFKNISYSRFLSILLKNTGWSYVCQPGLESIKHNITVRYDTNIYALLQDSMQSYRGVELEFVHELVGGRVQKVIKAYKDGGRGSFVGKRFEYGTNVRGITKTQEVANSEDDTVLYVDNVGIDVRYDVDFALKSAEVPEIEIGDTHYVIDKDFYPPMTIKARIGKIEVSFSDPTVNKIYLANNKRISGSAIEDEFDVDDIKDIIDDYDGYDDGYDDGGIGGDDIQHNHDNIVANNIHINKWLTMGSETGALGASTLIKLQNVEYETTISADGINTGGIICRDNVIAKDISASRDLTANRLRVYKGGLHIFEKVVFPDGSYIDINGPGKGEPPSSGGDVPDDPGSGDTPSYGDDIVCDTITASRIDTMSLEVAQANIFGKLYVTEEIKCELTTETNTLKVNTIEFSDGTTMTTSNGSGGGNTPSNPGTGSSGDSTVFDTITVTKIQGPDPGEGQSNMVVFEDAIAVSHISCPPHDDNGIIFFGADDHVCMHNTLTMFGDIYVEDGNVEVSGTVKATDFPTWSDESLKENIRYIDTSAMPATYSNNSTNVYKENLETRDYSSEDLLEKTDLYDFIVNQVNLCEYNYIGRTNKKIGFIANEYEGTKVGDKIVSLQERTKRDKETNKVIESKELFAYDTSNLLFATIGALQEEVRIRDEKIASLEDRLARLEAMLGINND